MKLDPSERSVLAYFFTEDAARTALQQLKGQGYMEARVDYFGHHGGADREGVGTGERSMTNAILDGGEPSDQGARQLLAATDPDVSGMADNPDERQPQFLLTAVVPAADIHQVARQLEQAGARV